MLVDTRLAVTILHANALKSSNSSNSTSLREPEQPVVAANGEIESGPSWWGHSFCTDRKDLCSAPSASG